MTMRLTNPRRTPAAIEEPDGARERLVGAGEPANPIDEEQLDAVDLAVADLQGVGCEVTSHAAQSSLSRSVSPPRTPCRPFALAHSAPRNRL
jgi:hypothetical protein